MGGIFQSCTSGEGKKGLGQAVSGGGIMGGAAHDIDDAALQAISNGIGSANRNELKQTVSLSFQLKDLPNLDVMSKTDAFIVLYAMKKTGGHSKMMKQKLG